MKGQGQWLADTEIGDYIVDHYMGVESMPNTTRPVRVFMWMGDDGKTIWQGNCRAFYLHVCDKYGMTPTDNGTAVIHTVLRKRGYKVRDHAPHVMDGEHSGTEPEPQEPMQHKIGEAEG